MTAKGGVAHDTPKAVAENSDIIFIIVPDTPHVESVLFGDIPGVPKKYQIVFRGSWSICKPTIPKLSRSG